MTVTKPAEARLTQLLRASGHPDGAFRITDTIGSCRGSTPIVKPCREPEPDDQAICAGHIRFFAPPEQAARLENATLDYDSSFMGKGLTLTWPHCPDCQCSQ